VKLAITASVELQRWMAYVTLVTIAQPGHLGLSSRPARQERIRLNSAERLRFSV
jgi:hypothetical protein